jgi:hypothetical protein
VFVLKIKLKKKTLKKNINTKSIVDPKAHHSECALSSEKKKLSRVQLNRMKCLHDHLSDVAIIMFDSELHIAADMLALFVVRA